MSHWSDGIRALLQSNWKGDGGDDEGEGEGEDGEEEEEEATRSSVPTTTWNPKRCIGAARLPANDFVADVADHLARTHSIGGDVRRAGVCAATAPVRMRVRFLPTPWRCR